MYIGYGISLKLTMAAFSFTKHFNVDVPHYEFQSLDVNKTLINDCLVLIFSLPVFKV
jgi:hypothetical protein